MSLPPLQFKRPGVSAAGDNARNDAGSDIDEDVAVVDPHPLLAAARALQAVAMIVAHDVLALPVWQPLALGPMRVPGIGLVKLLLAIGLFVIVAVLDLIAGLRCNRRGENGEGCEGQNNALHLVSFRVEHEKARPRGMNAN